MSGIISVCSVFYLFHDDNVKYIHQLKFQMCILFFKKRGHNVILVLYVLPAFPCFKWTDVRYYGHFMNLSLLCNHLFHAAAAAAWLLPIGHLLEHTSSPSPILHGDVQLCADRH